MEINQQNNSWKLLDIIYAISILIISGLISYGIINGLNKAFHIDIPNILLSLIASSISTAFGAMFILERHPLICSLKQIKRNKIKKIIILGFIGGLIIATIQFPYRTVFSNNDTPSKYIINSERENIYVPILFFFMVIIVPIFEELFFRGGIYRIIKNRYNILSGYLGTAILFAIMHTSSLYNTILHFLSSIILTYVYEKTNFIGTSILSHIIWNMIWLIAIYLKN